MAARAKVVKAVRALGRACADCARRAVPRALRRRAPLATQQSITNARLGDKPSGAFSVIIPRVFIAAVRSVLHLHRRVALRPDRRAAGHAGRDPLRLRSAICTCCGHIGVPHRLRSRAESAIASPRHASSRWIARPSTAPTIRATSIRRCCFEALHPQMHILYKAELESDSDPREERFVSAASSPSSVATRKRRCAPSRPARCPFDPATRFSIFPEGTRSRNDELAVVQEGRLHHGDQGASPGRSGGHQGGRAAMRRGAQSSGQ